MLCPVVQVEACINAVRRDISTYQDQFQCENGLQAPALQAVGGGLLPFTTSSPGAAELLSM